MFLPFWCILSVSSSGSSGSSCVIMAMIIMVIRAGPPSQKWSDQQITVNPTGSIHKKAREKKFDPKKVDFDEGVLI